MALETFRQLMHPFYSLFPFPLTEADNSMAQDGKSLGTYLLYSQIKKHTSEKETVFVLRLQDLLQ